MQFIEQSLLPHLDLEKADFPKLSRAQHQLPKNFALKRQFIRSKIDGLNYPIAWDALDAIRIASNLGFCSHPGFKRIGYETTLNFSAIDETQLKPVAALADFDRTAHHYETYFKNFLNFQFLLRLPVIITVACENVKYDEKTNQMLFTPGAGAKSHYIRFLSETIQDQAKTFAVFDPCIMLVPTSIESSYITPPSSSSPDEFIMLRNRQITGRQELNEELIGKGIYICGNTMEYCLPQALKEFCLGADLHPFLNGCGTIQNENKITNRPDSAVNGFPVFEPVFSPFDIGRSNAQTAEGEIRLLEIMKESIEVLLKDRAAQTYRQKLMF